MAGKLRLGNLRFQRPIVVRPASVSVLVGVAPPSKYQWGTHAQAFHQAETLKSHVFASVAAAVVVSAVAVPPIAKAPQQNVDFTLQAQVFRSATAPVTQTQPLRTIIAGPEQIDLSISGWSCGGPPLNQGPVPSATSAYPQPDPSQLAARIFPSVRTPPVVASAVPAMVMGLAQSDLTPGSLVRTPLFSNQGAVPPFQRASQDDPTQRQGSIWSPIQPTVITPNPIASFFATVPQFEERPTRVILPNQVSGQTTPVIPPVSGGPQRVDLTQQAWLTQPTNAPVVSYALKPIYAAPQLADFTQQGSIWSAQPAAPIILGATLYQTLIAAPQQYDFTLQPYFQAAIQNGIIIPVTPPDTSTPGRTTGDGHSGRIIRHDWWKSKDQVEEDSRKRRQRIQEAIEQQRPDQRKETYLAEGRKLTGALQVTQSAIEDVEAELAELRARIAEEGIKRTRMQLQALEQEMLVAQQAAQLLAVQEAVFREELEVIDVAYIALVMLELNS